MPPGCMETPSSCSSAFKIAMLDGPMYVFSSVAEKSVPPRAHAGDDGDETPSTSWARHGKLCVCERVRVPFTLCNSQGNVHGQRAPATPPVAWARNNDFVISQL